VRAIDTNVVVRLLVRDDEEQGRCAEALFRQSGGVWIALVVLVETVWVLRSAYKRLLHAKDVESTLRGKSLPFALTALCRGSPVAINTRP
jgi:predicted nucleic-acid-binding protein